MDNPLATIKEVQEGGKWMANHYLRHGYVLLAILEGARADSFPDSQAPGQQYRYYVRRNPIYVLGRPEGIEPAESPPRREPRRNDENQHTA